MTYHTKYSKKLIDDICLDLANGKSIKASLAPRHPDKSRPTWESFRKWLINTKKYPKLREYYSQAKQDGIEYQLSDASELITESVKDSKLKDKTDLGSTHLVKEFISLAKWRAERLKPRVYGKNDINLKHSGDPAAPLIVKWSN